MGLALRLLSAWTPRRVLLRELGTLDERTTRALDGLLERHAPGAVSSVGPRAPPAGDGLEDRRDAMAAAHEARIAALTAAVGRERAVNLARETLFRVGLELGGEARERLGVGDSVGDLVRAARVLYRVLGIDFHIERHGAGGWVMRVDRCALASRYSDGTCLALSAADEGVVRGLNPRASLAFEERLAGGAPACVARIHLGEAPRP